MTKEKAALYIDRVVIVFLLRQLDECKIYFSNNVYKQQQY